MAATPRGSVATAVVRFGVNLLFGDYNIPLASWVQWTNDGSLGTVFQILQEGIYFVGFTATPLVAPDARREIGISLDAVPDMLTEEPNPARLQMYAYDAANVTPSLNPAIFCSTTLHIPQSELDAGRGLIRCHISTTGAFGDFNSFMTIRRTGSCGPIPS